MYPTLELRRIGDLLVLELPLDRGKIEELHDARGIKPLTAAVVARCEMLRIAKVDKRDCQLIGIEVLVCDNVPGRFVHDRMQSIRAYDRRGLVVGGQANF